MNRANYMDYTDLNNPVACFRIDGDDFRISFKGVDADYHGLLLESLYNRFSRINNAARDKQLKKSQQALRDLAGI